MNKITIFVLVITYFNTFSQKIYLYDIESKSHIEFVNATYFINNEIIGGDYTDMNGFLEIKDKVTFDYIEFTALGYENLKINNNDIKNEIFLTRRTYVLDEIIVTNKNIVTIGSIDEKKKISVGIGKGIEQVFYIENNLNKTLLVKSFLFKVDKVKKKTAVRVHLYGLSANKFEPGDELIQSEIIHYLDEKTKGIIEIDVSDHGLEIPLNGVFVGLEAMGNINDSDGSFIEEESQDGSLVRYEVNYSYNKPISFIRNRFYDKTWSNSQFLKNQLTHIKSVNYPNASFGIKVYE